MAIFEVEIDGKVFEVDAPDQQSALSALDSFAKANGAPNGLGLPANQPKKVSGKFLPVTKDEKGNVYFDSDAGIVGMAKRAFNLPGEVMRGEVDPKSDEGLGRVLEMATIVTPMNPAVRSLGMGGVGALRARPAEVAPPSAEALKEAAKQGFERVREMGVEFAPAAVQKVADSIRGALEKDGILAELAPQTHSILSKLASPPEGAVSAPLTGVEAARRAFGHAAKNFGNPTEQLAAKRAMEGVDDLLTASDPSAVVAGPAAAVGKVIQDARANYAAGKRSERLSTAETNAELGAAANNSGANIGNSIRQKARAILTSPKQRAGFSTEEIAALEAVVRGSAPANVTRWVGNLLGGGGGLGALTAGLAGGAAGGMAAGPVGMLAGLVPPLVGRAAKAASNRLTESAMQRADALSRQRSPLYQEMLQGAPMAAPNLAPAIATLRAILGIPQSSP